MTAANNQIKIVSLDLDNTLWDVETTIIGAEKSMRQWMAEHVPEALEIYKSEATAEFRAQVVADNPMHVHDLTFLRTEVLFRIIAATGQTEEKARSLALAAFAVFFKGRNDVAFFPGALDMLETLSQRYTLFALTNGNADVQQVGISKFLAGAVSSADVGASKPSHLMFEAVLAKAGARADQCIHVGDHLIDDIEGARNAGLHTLWVNLTEQVATASQANIEVTNLEELPTALEDYQRNL